MDPGFRAMDAAYRVPDPGYWILDPVSKPTILDPGSSMKDLGFRGIDTQSYEFRDSVASIQAEAQELSTGLAPAHDDMVLDRCWYSMTILTSMPDTTPLPLGLV